MNGRRRLSTASPLRLLAVGVVLLWIVTPVALAGLITVAVRDSNAGDLGIGTVILLSIWALVVLVMMIVGFVALVAAVLAWRRARGGPQLAQTEHVAECAEN